MRFAPTALMLGNFVIGASVLAPTGMLPELSSGLHVTIREAGLLVTFGAVIMCLGSPLLSWASSRVDRRTLLAGSLLLVALTNFASAFASSFTELLLLRLLMLAAAAPFTPQAAGTSALLVPAEKRASTISYVFLGWSLAIAFGIPLVTLGASRFGYHLAYVSIGVVALVSFMLLVWRLPGGLQTPPLLLSSWGELAKNPLVLRLLLLTTLLTSGQFLVFTFLAPLLKQLTGATADHVGLVFALSGLMGFTGNVIASRIVGTVGAYRTAQLATTALALGAFLFALGAALGSFAMIALSLTVWGLGFASSNSMQQARLVAAAPLLAGASVALNTSVLYVGQALGSFLGGALFAGGHALAMGYAALAFILLGAFVLSRTAPAVVSAPLPAPAT